MTFNTDCHPLFSFMTLLAVWPLWFVMTRLGRASDDLLLNQFSYILFAVMSAVKLQTFVHLTCYGNKLESYELQRGRE